MIPRKKQEPAKTNGTLKGKIYDLLRIRLDPLPPPVDKTDDLLAVKCNLCAGTPLNPPESKTPAYSCELNCPTGALARINPKSYFAEVGKIEGLAFLDKTHAIGRNIHVSDPTKRLIHLLGIIATILLTAATIVGIQQYGLGGKIVSFLNMRWITGIAGLIVIAIAMAYPFRRQVYRQRRAPLRYWMLVHSYAGVIAAILIVLHGGIDSGGALTTALMLSFDLVIVTGLFGIFCYVLVPRLLTKMEGEPLLVDSLLMRRKELQEEITESIAASSENVANIIRRQVIPHFISIGYLLRQYVRRENLEDMIHSARESFQKFARDVTGDDQAQLDRVVTAAATLRRVDALIYLHRLLKLWLAPHVVFTSVMLALMFVHIFQVIYFAWR
jgi:hypothetical protein